jgi:hypothetical protein
MEGRRSSEDLGSEVEEQYTCGASGMVKVRCGRRVARFQTIRDCRQFAVTLFARFSIFRTDIAITNRTARKKCFQASNQLIRGERETTGFNNKTNGSY